MITMVILSNTISYLRMLGNQLERMQLKYKTVVKFYREIYTIIVSYTANHCYASAIPNVTTSYQSFGPAPLKYDGNCTVSPVVPGVTTVYVR